MIKLTFFFFLLIFFLKESYSQPLYGFEHFTENDGLSSNTVGSILQDHLGYLWFGTENGVVRYDGNDFFVLPVVPDDPNFLQTPLIRSLYEDSKGNIWIGSVGSVTRHDPVNNTFHQYSLAEFSQKESALLSVNSIFETKSGDIILTVNDFNGTRIKNGIYRISASKPQLEILEFKNTDSLLTIYQISEINSTYYICGWRGFGRIKFSDMTVEWLFDKRGINSFTADSNNVVWLAAHQYGLVKFNLDTKAEDNYNLYEKVQQQNDYPWFGINKMIFGPSGSILMATTKGLIRFNKNSGTIDVSVVEAKDPKALHSNFMLSILQDLSGSIWMGTYDAGISKYNIVQNNFTAYVNKPNDPTSISAGWNNVQFEYTENELWFCSFSEWLSIWDRKENTFRQVQLPNGFIAYHIIRSSNDEILIGGMGGVYSVNRQTWQFTKKNYPFSSENEIVNFIEEVKPGIFWFATMHGLYIYDEKNNAATKIDFQNLGIGLIGSNQIYHIIPEKNENIWIGTDDGLFFYDHNSKLFSRIGKGTEPGKSFKTQDINGLYKDINGNLWLGLWLGGLQKFNPQTGIITSYGKNEGFNSHSVQSILGDEENDAIWVSSFDGISRFDLKTETFSNFGLGDGVHANQFTHASALRTSDGLFIFGGQNGITVFRPGNIQKNISKPRIVLTDFKLFNQSVGVGGNSPLKSPINQTSRIVLDHDENDIAIDYFAAHYVDPHRNQYAYKLENYEDNWRYVGNQRTAIYPNLPPGAYVFHLKASNNNEVWNEEGVKVAIIINPPLWATWWAYLLYAVFGFGVLFSVRKMELNRRREKENKRLLELENKRKTEELEEARQLQLSMLPKELPKLPHLDIAVYMQTATEVGGDYYDFHVGLDGTLTVVIGDATGHGMKAGTMVTTVKSLFRSYGSNPDILFSFQEFSRCIREMNFGRIAMCLTMLKISDHKLQIATAGMPPSYIFRSETKNVDEFQFEAMPLGAMKEFQYKIKNTKLSSGDTILLLSDGLPELENKKGDMFGYTQIKAGFEKIADKSSDDIINYLKNKGAAWIDNADPDDDVTFVVIKVK